MIGNEAFLASACTIFAISSAPISRILVAHTMAAGVSYSSVVNAKPACVVRVTSKPSRFSASPSRFANNTLLSIKRIFAGLPGTIMGAPLGVARQPEYLLADQFQGSARLDSALR